MKNPKIRPGDLIGLSIKDAGDCLPSLLVLYCRHFAENKAKQGYLISGTQIEGGLISVENGRDLFDSIIFFGGESYLDDKWYIIERKNTEV